MVSPHCHSATVCYKSVPVLLIPNALGVHIVTNIHLTAAKGSLEC